MLNTAYEVIGFADVVSVDAVTRRPDHPAVDCRAAILSLHIRRCNGRIKVVVSPRGLYVCPTVSDLKSVQVELQCRFGTPGPIQVSRKSHSSPSTHRIADIFPCKNPQSKSDIYLLIPGPYFFLNRFAGAFPTSHFLMSSPLCLAFDMETRRL